MSTLTLLLTSKLLSEVKSYALTHIDQIDIPKSYSKFNNSYPDTLEVYLGEFGSIHRSVVDFEIKCREYYSKLGSIDTNIFDRVIEYNDVDRSIRLKFRSPYLREYMSVIGGNDSDNSDIFTFDLLYLSMDANPSDIVSSLNTVINSEIKCSHVIGVDTDHTVKFDL